MVMIIDDHTADHNSWFGDNIYIDVDIAIDVPGLPYLGEAMSWSCLATVLRFVAKLRCTEKSRD